VDQRTIREHHVICVSALLAHRFRPPLAIAHNFVDSLLLIRSIPVCAGEMVPVPFEITIGITTSREVKAQPCLNLIRLPHLLQPIIIIHLYRHTLLLFIRACLMIQHRVPIKTHAQLFRLLAQLEQFVFAAPFCGFAAFLVEFADVE
jgi:hypothetical protein